MRALEKDAEKELQSGEYSEMELGEELEQASESEMVEQTGSKKESKKGPALGDT